MIHRVIFGSIERFIGILIEHFAGAFPTWLSPIQVRVLPISDKYEKYAQTVLQTLKNSGIRADMDNRTEKIGYRIREAQLQKLPYMIIVGEKEANSHTISVRSRFLGEEGTKDLTSFLASIKKEIVNRENRETNINN